MDRQSDDAVLCQRLSRRPHHLAKQVLRAPYMRCVDDFALFDNDTAALIRWREHESRVSLLGCPPRHHWWQLKRLRPLVRRSRQRSRASSRTSRSRSSRRCSLARHGGSIRRMSQVGRRSRSGCGSARTDWRPPCSGGPLGQSTPDAISRHYANCGRSVAGGRRSSAKPPTPGFRGQPWSTGLAGQHAVRWPLSTPTAVVRFRRRQCRPMPRSQPFR